MITAHGSALDFLFHLLSAIVSVDHNIFFSFQTSGTVIYAIANSSLQRQL